MLVGCEVLGQGGKLLFTKLGFTSISYFAFSHTLIRKIAIFWPDRVGVKLRIFAAATSAVIKSLDEINLNTNLSVLVQF